MPRPRHTLDLDVLDREALLDAIDGVYRALAAARFDVRGRLLVPDEAELERLEERARELGLSASDPQDAREEVPGTRTLELLSGGHLAPGARYLYTETVPESEIAEPDEVGEGEEEVDGWVGTDLVVVSWETDGLRAFDFAMRDDPARSGFEEATTTGRVEHDLPAGTLTVRSRTRFPTPGGLLREGSRMLRVDVEVTIDLPGWFAAATGERDLEPIRLEVSHPLVGVSGRAVPGAEREGRWPVEAWLDVRGRGLARPLVAVTTWAMLRSLRRSPDRPVQEWTERMRREWARIARGLPGVPAFLDEVTAALARAGETGSVTVGPSAGEGAHPNLGEPGVAPLGGEQAAHDGTEETDRHRDQRGVLQGEDVDVDPDRQE